MFFARKEKPSTERISVKWGGRDVFLLYRLHWEPLRLEEKQAGDDGVYSISVDMIDSGGRRHTCEEAYDVARSRGQALRIFKMVSRGLVTPETALEIIADIIGIETGGN